MGLFVQGPTPFVADFLEFIANLDYPKAKIFLFLYSHVRINDLNIYTFLITGHFTGLTSI